MLEKNRKLKDDDSKIIYTFVFYSLHLAPVGMIEIIVIFNALTKCIFSQVSRLCGKSSPLKKIGFQYGFTHYGFHIS